MKVYLVYYSDWMSPRVVEGVFSTVSKAEEYIECSGGSKDDYEITEMEIDE